MSAELVEKTELTVSLQRSVVTLQGELRQCRQQLAAAERETELRLAQSEIDKVQLE